MEAQIDRHERSKEQARARRNGKSICRFSGVSRAAMGTLAVMAQ